MVRLTKWKTTPNGAKYREFKPGCLEICHKGQRNPSIFIVEGNLIDEYLAIVDKFEDLNTILDNVNKIKKEFRG